MYYIHTYFESEVRLNQLHYSQCFMGVCVPCKAFFCTASWEMFSITNSYVKHNNAIMRTRGVFSTKAYTINNLRTLNGLSVNIYKLLLQINFSMDKMSEVFILGTRLLFKVTSQPACLIYLPKSIFTHTGLVRVSLDPIHKHTTIFTENIHRSTFHRCTL